MFEVAALRLFIAVDLSEEAKGVLSGLLSRLRELDSAVRWVEPKKLHITLKFLGEVEERKVEVIKDSLRRAVSGFKPFRMRIEVLGAFPSARRPRVVWVGVTEGEEELSRLAGVVEEAMAGLGFPKEPRKFVAHVTLGRVKLRPSGGLVKFLERPEGVPKAVQEVEELILMRSILKPEGAEYTPLSRFPLGEGGA